jgi:uncharacterized protein with von Willebrand factor type A (vWA) domain
MGEYNMNFEELKSYLEPFFSELKGSIAAMREILEQDRQVWRSHHDEHYRLDREHRQAVDAMLKEHTNESRRVWEKMGTRIANLETQQVLDNKRFADLEKETETGLKKKELNLMMGAIVVTAILSIVGIIVGVLK